MVPNNHLFISFNKYKSIPPIKMKSKIPSGTKSYKLKSHSYNFFLLQNLLKGDVGHLISRNQSANILESKISKVNIVADDQLKRVSLAYSKDKEEIKERKDMQRKFNKKLKNASMFENSSLNNLKKNYMNTMVRKNRMHDRLAHIEKIGSSIQ